MVLLEFAMAPAGQGHSYSAAVARILDVIDRSGLDYQLTPMGTILEGEWAEVMKVVTDCFTTLSAEFDRVGCNLKIDWRKGPGGRLRAKTAAVEAKLGRKLRT